jgi:hypothetical protein
MQLIRDRSIRAMTRDNDVSIEIWLSDHPGQIPTVVNATCQVNPSTNLQMFARLLGIKLMHSIGPRFEAVRLAAGDQLFTYSLYERACKYFGVVALQVGQLSRFRNALAAGLVQD